MTQNYEWEVLKNPAGCKIIRLTTKVVKEEQNDVDY
jgi:hypothetical protein